jgi:hypothetical protein
MSTPLHVSQSRAYRVSSWGGDDTPKEPLGWAVERRLCELNNSVEELLEISIAGTTSTTATGKPSDRVTKVTLSPGTKGGLSTTVWPASVAASILISRFDEEANSQSPTLFDDILELGSGMGLAGLVAADRFQPNQCILTDRNQDDFLGTLERTKAANNAHLASMLQLQVLDWRDDPPQDALQEKSMNLVFGSDVAYYHHLVRPVLDTMDRMLDPENGVAYILGQMNRESMWNVYKLMKEGGYNLRTDEQDPPWPGETNMLLYHMELGPWLEHDVDWNDTDLQNEFRPIESVPMAVILYTPPDSPHRSLFMGPHDHVATQADQDNQFMSF